MLHEAAGQGQHFQALGHSFLQITYFVINDVYGPSLSRQITCFFPVINLAYKWVYTTFVVELAGLTCCLQTIVKI